MSQYIVGRGGREESEREKQRVCVCLHTDISYTHTYTHHTHTHTHTHTHYMLCLLHKYTLDWRSLEVSQYIVGNGMHPTGVFFD